MDQGISLQGSLPLIPTRTSELHLFGGMFGGDEFAMFAAAALPKDASEKALRERMEFCGFILRPRCYRPIEEQQ